MKAARPFLLPGTLDLLILKVLAAGPQHGYGIARGIQQRSKDVLAVEEGSLYPALHRIRAKRWVSSKWGTSESNRRAKFYELTAAGRRRLQAYEKEWRQVSAAVNAVLEGPATT